MADTSIRGLPDDVLATIDANARRTGLSRTEYIRRVLARERDETASETRVEDLAAFADVFGDLGDPDVMQRAWPGRPG